MNKKNWNLDAELNKLNTTGRDDFYTHLIRQEVPFWLSDVYNGVPRSKGMHDVDLLIKRRGFNRLEAKRFRNLAGWIWNNTDIIRLNMPKEKKLRDFMDGFDLGSSNGYETEYRKTRIYHNNYFRYGKFIGQQMREQAESNFEKALDEGKEFPVGWKPPKQIKEDEGLPAAKKQT